MRFAWSGWLLVAAGCLAAPASGRAGTYEDVVSQERAFGSTLEASRSYSTERPSRRLLASGTQLSIAVAQPASGQSSGNGISNQTIPAAWVAVTEGTGSFPSQLIGQDFLQCTSNDTIVVAASSWDPAKLTAPGFLVQENYTSAWSQNNTNVTWVVAARQAGPTTWELGRGYQRNGTQLSPYAWFANGTTESNATSLGTPNFYVLQGNRSGSGVTAANDNYIYQYQYASVNASLARNLYWFAVNGIVPCCISATVPDIQSNAAVPIGNVMGTCDPTTQQANITWRGSLFSQNITNARLLAVAVTPQPVPPGPNHTGTIVGAVVGGVIGLILLLWLLISAIWAWRTYSFRAKKRLIEDQVYSIVVGMRSDDIFTAVAAEEARQVNIDRFYNLLPFINRMPRNQYYASLSRSVAHGCLMRWSNCAGTGPRKGIRNGVLDPRFDGIAAEALTYAIMKHDVVWSATDKAILQQWNQGRAAQDRIVNELEETLIQPEVAEFLNGLDAHPVPADRITSRGPLATLYRLFCCGLPPRLVKETVTSEPAENRGWDESLFEVDLPTAAQPGIKRVSTDSSGLGAPLGKPMMSRAFNSHATTASSGSKASDHASAISAIIKQLQLDDWEIKPKEIEIMTDQSGQLCKLGEGAFGAVYKARWNGVQIVAVKKLHNVTSQSAKVEFLREVAVLKRLRAENIVRFLGVCIQDSQTMLVTEFMSNGSLYASLKASQAGDVQHTDGDLCWYKKGKRIAMDLTRGVAFLHSQGIVHFDLKSPNILLARDYSAKVADVGLAKFMTNEHFTQVSTIGTLAWAAPELLNPHLGAISSKIDVYSMGVVIWELVTGESPRFGQNWYRPPRVPEDCPQWVADLLAACMHSDPVMRPTSKDVFHALLADNFEP